MKANINQFQGCLLGGACGDALGYPVEFMKLADIHRAYGPEGITEMRLDGATRKALVSDDTQMTLFTANGLLMAAQTAKTSDSGESGPIDGTIRQACWIAYQRWLYTQIGFCKDKSCLQKFDVDPYPFIMEETALFAQRAPGNTCISALESGRIGRPDYPLNNSKGCGGVMRVAPCGLLFYKSPERAYDAAVTAAALTHGHKAGYVAAGALAYIIACIVNGSDLRAAVNRVMIYLCDHDRGSETYYALHDAVALSASLEISRERAIRQLGGGWVAEEALAIAVYCALMASNSRDAITWAVNHDGDSDSTGAICGNIVGALYTSADLPIEWKDRIELNKILRLYSYALYVAANDLK